MDSIPDDTVLSILSYLRVEDLITIEFVSKYLQLHCGKLMNYLSPIRSGIIFKQVKSIPNWCFKANYATSFVIPSTHSGRFGGYLSMFRKSPPNISVSESIQQREQLHFDIFRSNIRSDSLYINKFFIDDDYDLSSLTRDYLREYQYNGHINPKIEQFKRNEDSLELVMLNNSESYLSFKIKHPDLDVSLLELILYPDFSKTNSLVYSFTLGDQFNEDVKDFFVEYFK